MASPVNPPARQLRRSIRVHRGDKITRRHAHQRVAGGDGRKLGRIWQMKLPQCRYDAGLSSASSSVSTLTPSCQLSPASLRSPHVLDCRSSSPGRAPPWRQGPSPPRPRMSCSWGITTPRHRSWHPARPNHGAGANAAQAGRDAAARERRPPRERHHRDEERQSLVPSRRREVIGRQRAAGAAALRLGSVERLGDAH